MKILFNPLLFRHKTCLWSFHSTFMIREAGHKTASQLTDSFYFYNSTTISTACYPIITECLFQCYFIYQNLFLFKIKQKFSQNLKIQLEISKYGLPIPSNFDFNTTNVANLLSEWMAKMREIKLCLLGDSGVGKSSLVLRFVSDRFDASSTATIGASFMSKTFTLGEETFRYQIWDTAGQEKYKALAPMYYRGSHAAIIVYDLTAERTFEGLKRWVQELHTHGPPNIIIAIAANKCDLDDAREVEKEVGRSYAQNIDAVFREVSALTSENVNELFEEITKKLPPEKSILYNPQAGLKTKQPVHEKKCCE